MKRPVPQDWRTHQRKKLEDDSKEESYDLTCLIRENNWLEHKGPRRVKNEIVWVRDQRVNSSREKNKRYQKKLAKVLELSKWRSIAMGEWNIPTLLFSSSECTSWLLWLSMQFKRSGTPTIQESTNTEVLDIMKEKSLFGLSQNWSIHFRRFWLSASKGQPVLHRDGIHCEHATVADVVKPANNLCQECG